MVAAPVHARLLGALRAYCYCEEFVRGEQTTTIQKKKKRKKKKEKRKKSKQKPTSHRNGSIPMAGDDAVEPSQGSGCLGKCHRGGKQFFPYLGVSEAGPGNAPCCLSAEGLRAKPKSWGLKKKTRPLSKHQAGKRGCSQSPCALQRSFRQEACRQQ